MNVGANRRRSVAQCARMSKPSTPNLCGRSHCPW